MEIKFISLAYWRFKAKQLLLPSTFKVLMQNLIVVCVKSNNMSSVGYWSYKLLDQFISLHSETSIY